MLTVQQYKAAVEDCVQAWIDLCQYEGSPSINPDTEFYCSDEICLQTKWTEHLESYNPALQATPQEAIEILAESKNSMHYQTGSYLDTTKGIEQMITDVLGAAFEGDVLDELKQYY